LAPTGLSWPPITIRAPCRRRRWCEGIKLRSFANDKPWKISSATRSIRFGNWRDSPRRVLRSVDRLRAVWIRQVKIKQLGRWQKSRAFRQILSKPVLAALGPIEKGVMFILRKMKFIMKKRLEKLEVNKGKTRERLQRNIWNR